ncbi:MAG: chorismate-binding protein [Phycisphaerales bacterium]
MLLTPASPVVPAGVRDIRIETAPEAYMSGVARAKAHIAAGDCYQINLTHAMRATLVGSARGVFARLLEAADPWHGAYVEWNDAGVHHAVASASPELFLEFDAGTRRVRTRPMKGTRRSLEQRDELWSSEKERAELHMIVDLMRNDLSRVCEVGSVRVASPRTIEQHGTPSSLPGIGTSILQATALVEGKLRDDVGLDALLAATFPPGSITGAPKIRVMQLIDVLEARSRGPYCGCVGGLFDNGDLELNVAIRTALIRGNEVEYAVGAGIIADSDPKAEWEETLVKAGPLRALERG